MQTCGQGDQTFIVRNQCFFVNARLVVKTFKLGNGGELHQVFIACDVHGQEDNMKGSITCTFCAGMLFSILGCNVEFTTYDRFDACIFSFFIKLKSPVHYSMVSYCYGPHA